MSIKEQIRAEIERQKEQISGLFTPGSDEYYAAQDEILDRTLAFLDSIPEQPVSDHHEIEVEFRGEKVTISREFYRNGEMNYSTSEQDDNAIWAALRAWCEKKGITPFELYPKQSEQPVEGLEKEVDEYVKKQWDMLTSTDSTKSIVRRIARHFAEWQKKLDDLETADLLAIAHLQGMEQQKAKMMEKAVEGYVGYYEDNLNSGILVAEAEVGRDYHNGDKVRVIVIKEDEK